MQTVQRIINEVINLNLARQKHIGDNTVNPLVSVRIPTLNRSSILLERAIPSALGQTYKEIEVIVVGDNCTDNTEEVLSKVKTHKPLIWHNLPERNKHDKELLKDPETRWFMGPVRATNRATELCSGEWVAQLDDDDFWTPTHISDLLEFAQKGNYEMVYGNYVEARYGVQKEVENGASTWLMKKYIADIFKLDPECYKKEVDRVSDIDVFMRMKTAQVKMGHLKKVVAYVLPRPGEETIGHDQYMLYKKNKDATKAI